MPARPAIAARCTMALVEPEIACRITEALRSDDLVRISLGFGPPAMAISAARLPVASAKRQRSDDTAGAVAEPGSMKPSVSARQAMVEAVPITIQVPGVGIHSSWARLRAWSSSEPSREDAHGPPQSAHAPRRVPPCLPA